MRKKPQYATLNRRKVRGKMTLEYMSGMLGLNTYKIVSVVSNNLTESIEIYKPPAVWDHLIFC